MKTFIKKYANFIPLALVELYLIATLLLYQFGPLDWQTENQGMFWFFIAAYHIAFILGYIISAKWIKLSKPTFSVEALDSKKYSIAIWVLILICIVCACIEYKNTTHAPSYIPYDLPKNFINGLINPSEQYYNKFAPEGYTSNKGITLISSLFSFLYVSLIPILLSEWKRISIPQKTCIFGIILFKVIFYVSIGTNKGIFDTMFYFVGILVILCLLNLINQTDRFIDKKTLIKVSAFALFLIVFSFAYFTVNISSRVQNPVDFAIGDTQTADPTPDATTPDPAPSPEPEAEPAPDLDPMPEATPEATPEAGSASETERPGFFKRMYFSVTNYLTQGYYGMSLALDEDFTTTYGIGNSQFLRSNFESLFGINVEERTYQHKITEQWHEDQKWHSFYSYIANDVSFYGVILVMFLIGIFFGLICKDVILHNSLIGKMLLLLFVILFMYMPANNQVFTSMATFMAFFELSFLWILSKIHWKKGIKHEQ